MSNPSAVDHETLWQKTLVILESLSSLKIASYRIKRTGGEIFVGGFGDVEQAELRETLFFGANSVVALKKLRPTGDRAQRIRVIASLARELYVWHDLRHPNILPLEGFYYDESSLKTAWIATRWQKNGNVLKYVETTNADMDTRRKLALDTARGLAYLHGLSPPVCHADIKAENTLVNDSGDAMLCDFGLARILEDVPSGLTTTSAPGCTLRYAAPELVAGDGSVHSLASDVWAWGCLLLVVLTGILPYADKDRDVAIALAISQKQPPGDLSSNFLDLPKYVRAILRVCWRPESGKRAPIGWCRSVLCGKTIWLSEDLYSTPSSIGPLNLPMHTTMMLATLASGCGVSRSSLEAISDDKDEGRSGPVVLAKIRVSETVVAETTTIVKVVRSSGDWNHRIGLLDALIRELWNWNKLQHQNILGLDGVCFDETSPKSSLWILTSWQANGSVAKYVKENKLEMNSRVELALDIARGLAFLHDLSPPIYHGNINTESVFVDSRGNALIGGFASPSVLAELHGDFPSTGSDSYTVRWFPHEVFAHRALSRSRGSDIWSWGCVLLVITSNVLPYADHTEYAVIRKSIVRRELPAYPGSLDVPDYILLVLRDCWKYLPKKRPSIEWCQATLSAKPILLFDDVSSDLSTTVDRTPKLFDTQFSKLASDPPPIRVSRSEFLPMSRARACESRFGFTLRADWKGHSPKFRSVAVEVFRPPGSWNQCVAVLEALRGELHEWYILRHQNILRLFGVGFDDATSSVWIITPWQSNGSLATYLQDKKPGLDVRMDLVLNVADGLGYLHGLVPPIYHGSLEVEHVLVDAYGTARIGGFGPTRALQDFQDQFPSKGAPRSNLRYSSPEVLALGGSSPSRGSDVWALGCVLLVVVTDLLPYADCAEGTAVRESIGRGELPANTSAISAPWFISFALDLCWERDPGSRLRTSWFSTILSQNAADCFSLLAKLPFGKVPVRWKSETPSWQAVVNPCLQTVYRVEPQLGFEDSENSRIFDVSSDGKQMAVADCSWLSLYDIDTACRLSRWDTCLDEIDGLGRIPSRGIRWRILHWQTEITTARFDTNCSLVATGHENNDIRIWQLANQALQVVLRGRPGLLDTFTFRALDTDLRLISIRMNDGNSVGARIETWDVETGNLQHTTPAPFGCKLIHSPGHRQVVVVRGNRERKDCPRCVIDGSRSLYTDYTTSPDHVCVQGWALTIWDPTSPSAARVASSECQDIPAPEQTAVIMPEFDAPRHAPRFNGPQSDIDSVSTSSDGRLAASGSSWGGDLLIWDLEARLPVIKMRGRGLRQIQDVTFRPGSTSSAGYILYSYQDERKVSDGWSITTRRSIGMLRYEKRSS